jgi:small nuclear ribonucleoprotein (snRNP)-like protein
MKRIKLFEDFKNNNIEGTLISFDDIINCIKNNGVVYATIVNDLVDHDSKEPLRPVDIDDDGTVTVEFDGREYTIKLKNIEKIEY